MVLSDVDRRPLLRQALTHRSHGNPHNERLEYLGDALIGWFAADLLFHSLPKADEGELTRRRAELVRESSLAELARRRGLGELLRLGGGELKSGGWRRESILADAYEAVVAALCLEQGRSRRMRRHGCRSGCSTAVCRARSMPCLLPRGPSMPACSRFPASCPTLP